MAIAFANKLQEDIAGYSSGVPSSSVGAITTTTGNYYILTIPFVSGSTFTSVTGPGLSFTLVKSQLSGTIYTHVYGAYCSSGGTGTISFTPSQTDSNNVRLVVDEVTGMAPSNPLVQTVGAAAITCTLAALGSVSNATYLVAANFSVTGVEAGWTRLAVNGASTGVATAYKLVGDTTPSYTSSSSFFPTIIGFEIKAFVPPPDAYGTAPSVSSMMLLGAGS